MTQIPAEWTAETTSQVIAQFYDQLSQSDKVTLQHICIRGLRKSLTGSLKSIMPTE